MGRLDLPSVFYEDQAAFLRRASKIEAISRGAKTRGRRRRLLCNHRTRGYFDVLIVPRTVGAGDLLLAILALTIPSIQGNVPAKLCRRASSPCGKVTGAGSAPATWSPFSIMFLINKSVLSSCSLWTLDHPLPNVGQNFIPWCLFHLIFPRNRAKVRGFFSPPACLVRKRGRGAKPATKVGFDNGHTFDFSSFEPWMQINIDIVTSL